MGLKVIPLSIVGESSGVVQAIHTKLATLLGMNLTDIAPGFPREFKDKDEYSASGYPLQVARASLLTTRLGGWAFDLPGDEGGGQGGVSLPGIDSVTVSVDGKIVLAGTGFEGLNISECAVNAGGQISIVAIDSQTDTEIQTVPMEFDTNNAVAWFYNSAANGPALYATGITFDWQEPGA